MTSKLQRQDQLSGGPGKGQQSSKREQQQNFVKLLNESSATPTTLPESKGQPQAQEKSLDAQLEEFKKLVENLENAIPKGASKLQVKYISDQIVQVKAGLIACRKKKRPSKRRMSSPSADRFERPRREFSKSTRRFSLNSRRTKSA
jgi:hypothetical protein